MTQRNIGWMGLALLFLFTSIFGSMLAFSLSDLQKTTPDITRFIEEMVQTHHFDRAVLEQLFAQMTIQKTALDSIQKPAEKLPWYRYAPIFLKPERIEAGVVFWKNNKPVLDRATRIYGIPPEIIVALIGVETFYGRQKGSYPVFDALATLAFYYPERAAFFRSELKEFLLFTREEKMDPTQIRGSYAGAMGYPQFISSSARRYAVDFTNSGQRDLMNNVGNAIGSVGNYLKEYGWAPKQPIVIPAQVKGTDYQSLKIDVKPQYPLSQLETLGIRPETPYPKTLTTAFLTFEEKDSTAFWLGFNNFYVITRYNRSPNYALAVYLLSTAIREQYLKTAT
jgi:membrane-bound lytic murein transglycosylase B